MFRLGTNHPDLGSSAVFAKRNALLERSPAFVALNFHPPLNLQQGGGETQLVEASCSLAAACDQLTGFWFGCLAGGPRGQKNGGVCHPPAKISSLLFLLQVQYPRTTPV